MVTNLTYNKPVMLMLYALLYFFLVKVRATFTTNCCLDSVLRQKLYHHYHVVLGTEACSYPR